MLIAAVMILLAQSRSCAVRLVRAKQLWQRTRGGPRCDDPECLSGHVGVRCDVSLDIEIDIGTMMTASVAMGVAVDDTIHFLSWFRAHLDRGMNRVDAVIETYRRVGPAMTQTTIVGGLGLFVFAFRRSRPPSDSER